MPRLSPHPFALFSLVSEPGNERAERAVSHPNNSHLTSISIDGRLALDIGSHIRGKSSKTLATLGRGIDSDIYIEGSNIAKIQCSFEIDLDTGVVMFCDRSFANSTQVFGENVMPFEHNRIRQALVRENLNTVIGMGGERRNLFQFKLNWHRDRKRITAAIRDKDRVENPRLARTIDDAPTTLQSRRETRFYTSGSLKLKIRYVADLDMLGRGQFGAVYKAIDVDSGRLMAVKILKRSTQQSQLKRELQRLKREVEALSELSNPHIVDYIASQGWDGPQVEIFMGLKEGTLESLVKSGIDVVSIANSVFPQMLQALDSIAWKGIIHRDVKPENILYMSQPGGQYHFQLGDFGLCNLAIDAKSPAGTPMYTAPEVHRIGEVQTCKVDVWSLFVTMLWTLDIMGFRHNQLRIHQDVQAAVVFAVSNDYRMARIQEMAIVNPNQRASAAQMLVKYCEGRGLSTPRNQVPALPNSPLPAIAANEAPARPLADPIPGGRVTGRKARGVQKNASSFTPAFGFRVEKARAPPRLQQVWAPPETLRLRDEFCVCDS